MEHVVSVGKNTLIARRQHVKITITLCSNCTTFIQLCGEFTSDNIKILDIIVNPASNKRQAATTIGIVTYVIIPPGLPITSAIEFPLLPPEVLIQALTDNMEEFETVTGIQVAETPTLFLTPSSQRPPFDFDNIAAIVSPIVAAVLVLSLITGVGVVICIA